MTRVDLADWGARRRRRFPSDRWGQLVCRAVWDETADMRSFFLTPQDGSRIEHNPGQFMTFRIDTPDGPIERCYTIASSAARDGGIEISVKRQNGPGARALYDTLVPGAAVEALGPSGRFGPATWPGTAYALVAAGSGITPMLSIVRTAADWGMDLDIALIQVAPTSTDLVAADEIDGLSRRLRGLVHVPIVTRGPGGVRPDADLLNRVIPDLSDRTVLCCGPHTFMEMVRSAAHTAGVSADRYGEESFDFSSPLPGITAGVDTPNRTVLLSRTGRSFECAETSTILAAMKEAGLPLPSSCARGMCGTCKTFKHAGEVVMAHEGGIRQREIDRGFILPCVSRPLTDIILDC